VIASRSVDVPSISSEDPQIAAGPCSSIGDVRDKVHRREAPAMRRKLSFLRHEIFDWLISNRYETEGGSTSIDHK